MTATARNSKQIEIIRTIHISIYSVSNRPIDRKERKEKRRSNFSKHGCRRYLTSFATRSGTRSSRLRETLRERERERISSPSSFLQLFLKISNRFFPIQQTSRGLIHTTPLSRITTAILATVG